MRGLIYKDISRLKTSAVSIASATTSSEIALEGRSICGLYVSALTTATTCTFTVSSTSGGSFYTLQDKDGNAYTVTLTASRYIWLDPAIFSGVEYVKIVLNTTGSLTANLHLRNLE